MQYIAKKPIKSTEVSEEKTFAGSDIIKVIFEDGTIEFIPKMMFDKIASDKECDVTELRDKRIFPMVEMTLTLLREWGIKIGELPYFSQRLNLSIDTNANEAYTRLFSKYMPKPNTLEDVDLSTIDRVLKNEK